ncbi:MAG TPA: YbhB/YbcL family Raf kinase inhibitor-like protein [Ktedonobacteraceae bacterium]|nr:YbhB/YbcL family Raf kinase inhibitor-like protein [Ktedonobacteraceae bacterium]
MIDQEAAKRAFRLTSPDFEDNGPMPERNVYNGMHCHGQNEAPTLHWEHAPDGTQSFALLVNDIDAPVAGGFHHWVVYNIPASVSQLEGNDPYEQGTTSMNTHAYFGPCPPATGEPHHYIFTLYALKTAHIQEKGLTFEGLIQAIGGHVLAATTLVGQYQNVPE